MVNVPKSVQPFWDKFQASIRYDASALFYEAFHFDDNEQGANALAALVLSGQKRATAGLLWTNERTNKPLPTVGSFSVVTDWQGTALCIIESTHIEVVPFDSVSDGFAALEGEGDKTLRYWREAHWRFFSRECERIGREPDLRMPVVCEQFKVVYPASMPSITPLTPAVADKVEALFPPESREAAGRMLAERCGADLPLSTHMGRDPSAFDRIRFAVLKLSRGDLEQLRREIDGAHFDWRDTLMAAGFGEDIHAHLQWKP